MVAYNDSWSPYVKALYWDKKGDWPKAHGYVDDMSTPDAAWVHAYLHRKEGDESNASYWYRRAEKEKFQGSLDKEWEMLWDYFYSSQND